MISFLDSKELRKEAEAFALKVGNGKYAIISAHDRKGKPVTIKASGDERPGFVPPCFDKEAYDATLSAYPERKDLLASLFTYHRWDGKAFSPDEAEDHPILRAADYALRHKLEMTGIASFMINDGHIIYEESLPDTLWKMLGLRFIYADESIAVIDKDAGLLSAPGKGDEKLDSASYRFHRLCPWRNNTILFIECRSLCVVLCMRRVMLLCACTASGIEAKTVPPAKKVWWMEFRWPR